MRSMQRISVLALAALAALPLAAAPAAAGGKAGGAATAQPAAKEWRQAPAELLALRREAKDLAITEAETTAIAAILEGKAGELARAASEIKILQARLERLMLDPEPSVEEIRKLVRSSLDYEYQIRMVRIERSLALRKLLGDRRWAVLERLQRAFEQARKAGALDAGGSGELAGPLVELLGKL